jgi:DNA-binding NarL/FixJ family response regulator
MIRVLVADDQTLVRQGIRSLLGLSQAVTVVGEAADGEEALARLGELRPDVLLLDLRMPKLDGLGVLRALVGVPDAPPTLILTTFDDDELVLGALRLGAKGFLLKDVSLAQLLGAVETLAAGGTLVQPAVTERLLRGLPRTTYPSLEAPERLTKRELEVVRLMAGGYSNREIAGALGMGEGTVKNHVSSVLSKLGVRDRTRAVLRALELGCV